MLQLQTIGIIGVTSVIALKLIRKILERYWGKIDPNNEISIQNKIIIITGSNTGIGKVTALELASRGGHVILACRNIGAAESAICEIRQTTTNGTLVPMTLDLASQESIVKFVNEFKSRYDRLHILINNAGIYSPVNQKLKSADGYEIHFAVNHLGHFLLTNLLLETLKKSAPARILTLSSLMHCGGNLNWSDIMYDTQEPGHESIIFHPLYANSKLANALFSQELAKRLAGIQVNTYCLCPGLVATDMTRNMEISWYFQIFSPLMTLLRKTPKQGCQTTLYCALSKDLEYETGQMYQHCAFWPPSSRKTLSDEDSLKLWKLSEDLTNLNKNLKEMSSEGR